MGAEQAESRVEGGDERKEALPLKPLSIPTVFLGPPTDVEGENLFGEKLETNGRHLMQPMERVSGVLAAVFTFPAQCFPSVYDAKIEVLKDSEVIERGKMMDRGHTQGTALVLLSLPVLTAHGGLRIQVWCSGTRSFWSGLSNRSLPNPARARET